MIVKNESEIIINTLDNIRQHIQIDFFCISDTGSTDQTMYLIENYLNLHQLNGLIWSEKWINFSHNRNIALERCKANSNCNYMMVFDADDRFHGNFYIDTQYLKNDIYLMKFKIPQVEERVLHQFYSKQILFKTDLDVIWCGVLHEFLDFKNIEKRTQSLIGSKDFYIQAGHFGARNKDVEKKYLQDFDILKNAYEHENDPRLKHRYCFYLAKTALMQDIDQAIYWYKIRLLGNDNSTLEYFLAGYNLVKIYKDKYALTQDDTYIHSALEILNKSMRYHKHMKEIPYQISLLLSTVFSEFETALKYAQQAKNIYDSQPMNSFDYDDEIIGSYGIDYQIIYCLFYLKRYQETMLYIQNFKEKDFLNHALNETMIYFESVIQESTSNLS